MQCIVTALKAESQPLIDHFNFSRDPAFKFPVFKKDDLYLLGTGVGKANIRARILSFLNQTNPGFIQFINIGIAGGNPSTTKISECYFVNKINDSANEKTYYPDCLINHAFEERSLVTVERVVSHGASHFTGLVDMEASEIFKVCSSLLPIHRLAFLKIVSDHMDLEFDEIIALPISEWISNHMKSIESFLSRFKNLHQEEAPILSGMDIKWINEMVENLFLTETQSQQLHYHLKGFRLRNGELNFPELDLSKPTSKTDRNRLFKNICDQLSI